MQDWISKLFSDPDMVGMGHDQSQDDLNLGLGWIYYGLARTLRPKTVVVIGSYRGFVPLVLGKALQDNGQGEVIFIDPSLVDGFWKCPDCVKAHFATYGVHNIRHQPYTTQEFVDTETYRDLDNIGLLYIDGYHTAEFARFDHEAFADKMSANGVVLFHDSVRERRTRIYGDDLAYTHTVCHYMDELRADPKFEALSFPEGDGLTLVKKVG